MIVLGLTGPSGAGKGVVGDAFRREGISVLDTDAVYHALIASASPCTEELSLAFGEEILKENGGVDRRRLASLVFTGGEDEKEKKSTLNRITHRYVIEAMEVWLRAEKERGARACVIDAPLLIEAGLHLRCDYVVAVLASSEVRLSRIMMRDGISLEGARARISAQPKDDFYRAHAEFVFCNEGDVTDARRFVSHLLLSIPLT